MSMSDPTRRTRAECDCEINYYCDVNDVNYALSPNWCALIIGKNNNQETRVEIEKDKTNS